MIIRRMTYLRGRPLINVANELVSIDVDATGGTFTATFGGQTTGNIAFDATPATVKTAIELLSTVDADDWLISGGPGQNGGGKPYYFASASLDNEGAWTTNAASLTGGGTSATVAVEEAGGNLRSIRYSHVPTANGVITAIQLIRFYDTRGNAIEVHPLFLTIDKASSKCYVNINRGSSTPSATDYDTLVNTGTAGDAVKTVDLTQGVVSIANISIFFDTGFGELIVPGNEWNLTAWDPKGHIYDT